MRALGLAAILGIALSAFATSTANTSITGRVTTAGAPAIGVTVTATSPALQVPRVTVTAKSGRYWLTALPPGEYEVSFSRGGMQTLIKTAVVELARVARVDANLEPSEDEESITSTAKVVGVADTTVITSHYSDQTLDRLPVGRNPFNAGSLSPGGGGGLVIQDDAVSFAGGGGEEALEQLTILRGGLGADADFFPPLTLTRTRAGGEEFSFSLRDTLTSGSWIEDVQFFQPDDGVHQLFEATAGGRIVPGKLWFFAGAMYGDDLFATDRRGLLAKLTGQLGAAHNLTALYEEDDFEHDFGDSNSELATLRYTGTAGPLWTNEAVISYTSNATVVPAGPAPRSANDHHSLFVRSTYVLGNHILSAGGGLVEDDFYDETALFANDRWVVNRLTLNLGLRHEDNFMPRVAASFDLRGDGRHAIQATVGDYAVGLSDAREYTLGYATALGNGGHARIDAIRRDFGPVAIDNVQFELRYSLFDRLQASANYTWSENDTATIVAPRHVVNAWVTVALPVFGEHEFAATVMERYRSEIAEPFGAIALTDVALRYALPVRTAGLTLAVDVTNVFNHDARFLGAGRAARAWVRVRL